MWTKSAFDIREITATMTSLSALVKVLSSRLDWRMRAGSLLKSQEGKGASWSQKAKSVVQLPNELMQKYLFLKFF